MSPGVLQFLDSVPLDIQHVYNRVGVVDEQAVVSVEFRVVYSPSFKFFLSLNTGEQVTLFDLSGEFLVHVLEVSVY